MLKNKKPPIVVDLDKTLSKTDTLVEAILLLIKNRFIYLFVLPFWIFKGKVYFKSKINSKITIPVELLPYNQELLKFIKSEKQVGRRIYLATASHIDVANKVATHLNIFDEVIASNNSNNVKGITKLKEIEERIGSSFTYAGDCSTDIPIWDAAETVILVNPTKGIENRYKQANKIELSIIQEHASLKDWMKAIRVHQWVKNTLIFVPLFVFFKFDTNTVLKLLLGFLSFSLLASATYIFNDMFDLFSDRAHPNKKDRALASAKISISSAAYAIFILSLISITLAANVNALFLISLFVYLIITVSYSLVLKRYVLLDVVILSLLYTVRILAGSAAINVMISEWLLVFSVFIFLSLALVKRCSELVSLRDNNRKTSRGRDYRVSDLTVLWPFGVGSAVAAIIVFCQYINASTTQERYTSPIILWLAVPGLIYWLMRLWVKTGRGEMHDDPIVYALNNRGSLITIFYVVIVMILAQFISLY